MAINGGTHTTRFVLSGSTMSGNAHTFQGPATWSGGTIYGAGSSTFANDLAITGPNNKTIQLNRTVNLDGTNLNQLTHQRLTDFGGGPTFYDCMVEVEACA